MKLIDQKKFKTWSKLKKRVAICEDVLYRMRSRNIIIQGAQIFHPTENSRGSQKEINTNGCHVCIKGAIIASWIGSFNKYHLGYIYSEDLPEEIIKLFGFDILDIMEQVLEATTFYWHRGERATFNQVKSFYSGFRSDAREKWNNEGFCAKFHQIHARLIARRLINNIIKNKGVLVLDDGKIIN